MTENTNENETTLTEKPSMFGMIMNPGVQLQRIKQNPKILVAWIVLTILTTIGMYMMASGMDISNEPGYGTMGEEEMMMVNVFAKVVLIMTGLFTPILSILISSAIYLAVARVAGYAVVTFRQLFSMNTYVYVITTLSVLVNGLAMMLVGGDDGETLFTSVNSIVGADGPLGVFLNAIEVFTIWNLIITALGLQIVGKFSKGLSWGVVVVLFVLSTGFSMLASALTTMMGV